MCLPASRSRVYNPGAMKPAPLLLFLALTVPLAAQTINEKQLATVCGAPVLGAIANFEQQPRGILADAPDPARPSIAAFARASERLLSTHYNYKDLGQRLFILMVSDSTINATTHTNATGNLSFVCIPSGFVDFIGNEDELAFIIAHEIGHAIDFSCLSLHNRDHVVCETRADEIGFKMMREANYSPFAAAGAFGRIEMYSGDTSTGVLGMFRQLASDHPITPNRIANMRRLLLAETHP